jgi:gliding motility-associated-like protein
VNFTNTGTPLGPYSYSWSNGSSSQTINEKAGIYTVTVTDRFGCRKTKSATLANPPVLTTKVDSVSDAKCYGAKDGKIFTTAGGGTAPYSYLWTNTTEKKDDITNLGANNYTLTVTDANGCTATVSTEIKQPEELLVDIKRGLKDTICRGDVTKINTAVSGGTQPYKYKWTPPQGLDDANSPNPGASPETTTTYTVTVTDKNGCAAVKSAGITVNQPPIVNAGNDTIIPYGTSTILKGKATGGSGDYSYSWTPADSLLNPMIAKPKTKNLHRSTVFELTVYDNETGCTGSDKVIISIEGDPLKASVKTEPKSICLGDSAVVDCEALGGSGKYSYKWSSMPGDYSSTEKQPIVKPAVTTTYTVTVDDGFNKTTATGYVIVYSLPDASAGADREICQGEKDTLIATGGTEYKWNTQEYNDTIIVEPRISTLYKVIVTDKNGCVNSDSVYIKVNDLPEATAGKDTSICKYGTAKLTGGGGTIYQWSNGSQTQSTTVMPLESTVYTVTVTNGKGCKKEASVRVIVYNLPAANAGIDTSICKGGEAKLRGSGGTEYKWSTGEEGAKITVAPEETKKYILTVTDEHKCSNTDTVTVIVNPLPSADAGEDKHICQGDSVAMKATGGQYYKWSNNENTSEIQVKPEETTVYTVTVTDSKGCRNTDSVKVIITPLPVITLTNNAVDGEAYFGQLITFTVHPENLMTYIFYVNDKTVQSGSRNEYKTNTLKEGDKVYAEATEYGCKSEKMNNSIKLKPIINAFTPDGDNVNDLYLKGLDIIILNRWGQELYRGKEGWDGKYKGEDCSGGTYYYIIYLYDAENNKSVLKGPLELVRGQ